MTQSAPDDGFLNAPALIDASAPRARPGWLQMGVAGFLLAILVGWLLGRQQDDLKQWIPLLLSFGFTIVLVFVTSNGFLVIRRARREQAQLETVEELIQLRRWPQAAMALQAYLSRPIRSIVMRAQGLLCLALVLARYHRYEDAVRVYDQVLEEVPLDDASAHAVRLGRAMALLCEERLLDADRAIADLRRGSRGTESPGLALLEIYRDVKTGHPREAIQMFQERLELMRKSLGHRVADAWGLVARAYDLLGQTDEARVAYENGTVLSPVVELLRRYPEIKPVAEKFPATPTPAGVV